MNPKDTETSDEELRADVFSGKTLKQNLRDIIARNNTGYSYQELVDVLNSDSTDDMLEDDELESVDKTVNLLAHLYVHMAKAHDQQIALAAHKQYDELLRNMMKEYSNIPLAKRPNAFNYLYEATKRLAILNKHKRTTHE